MPDHQTRTGSVSSWDSVEGFSFRPKTRPDSCGASVLCDYRKPFFRPGPQASARGAESPAGDGEAVRFEPVDSSYRAARSGAEAVGEPGSAEIQREIRRPLPRRHRRRLPRVVRKSGRLSRPRRPAKGGRRSRHAVTYPGHGHPHYRYSAGIGADCRLGLIGSRAFGFRSPEPGKSGRDRLGARTGSRGCQPGRSSRQLRRSRELTRLRSPKVGHGPVLWS